MESVPSDDRAVRASRSGVSETLSGKSRRARGVGARESGSGSQTADTILTETVATRPGFPRQCGGLTPTRSVETQIGRWLDRLSARGARYPLHTANRAV